MTLRLLLPADLPVLAELAAKSPYPYPPLTTLTEPVFVVADDTGTPVAAFIPKPILEGYLLIADMHPAAKLAAIRALHGAADALCSRGWDEINVFLPPAVEKSFGRRLRQLGWGRNWTSFFRKL